MLYISDSDSDIGSRRPFKRQRSHTLDNNPETVISVNSTSLSSMASSVLLIRPSTNQPIEYANNSSGWSSLLDMSSAISLLSSYTPQKSPYPTNYRMAVNPIDDIDESRPPPIAGIHHPAPVYPYDGIFARKQEPRPRVGPMDIDLDDRDSSWLNATPNPPAPVQNNKPNDEPLSRKRRLLSTQETKAANAGSNISAFTLSNTPFTFNMPVPASTAAGTSSTKTQEPMAADSRPISPNAVRKIRMRRRRMGLRESFAKLFGLLETKQDRDGDGWTTDDESSTTDKPASSSPRRTVRQTRRVGRQVRQRRRDGEWSSARGVDRVLALMGSKVDEPTVVERLQMHRDLPYVISGYLQLGFNVFMVGTVLVIVVNILLTIQRDINAKVQEYAGVVSQEILSCSKQYVDNRCDPDMRVPAMEPYCNAWETCMQQDPKKVGRAKVSAETLAGIVNGFIEPLSFKTMVFFLLLFFGTMVASNFAFGAYRHNRVNQQVVRMEGGDQDRDRDRNRDRDQAQYGRGRSASNASSDGARHHHRRQNSGASGNRTLMHADSGFRKRH
ncbi:hypothetical protein H4R99_000110 [Coemansia sp. RSA 1722]|nr:hypothetical protein IWW45_000005 [Coemansia sp. RSA 485]KAJ2597530.1 hypothetical protein GGF39_003015 [Coemansia sp. RSA 1721]KAJ2606937.1 hypothetical protein H4R99_000110 [Coemansia sp. RSA 1722]